MPLQLTDDARKEQVLKEVLMISRRKDFQTPQAVWKRVQRFGRLGGEVR